MTDEGYTTLTSRQLADRLGIGKNAAHQRMTRAIKAGKWRAVPENHPGAPIRAEVPNADLINPPSPPPRQKGGDDPDEGINTPTVTPPRNEAVEALAAALERAQTEASRLADLLLTVQAEKAAAEARAVLADGLNERLQAEVDDLAGQMEEAGKVADGLRAEVAGQQALKEETQAQIDEHNARSWWKRLRRI